MGEGAAAGAFPSAPPSSVFGGLTTAPAAGVTEGAAAPSSTSPSARSAGPDMGGRRGGGTEAARGGTSLEAMFGVREDAAYDADRAGGGVEACKGACRGGADGEAGAERVDGGGCWVGGDGACAARLEGNVACAALVGGEREEVCAAKTPDGGGEFGGSYASP